MPWWQSAFVSRTSLECPSRKMKCLSSSSTHSDTAASSSSGSHWLNFLPLQSRHRFPELDVAIARTRFYSSEVSPETTPPLQSPNSVEQSLVRGSSGVPQPLPLPESAPSNHPFLAGKPVSGRISEDMHNDRDKLDGLNREARLAHAEAQKRAARPRSEWKFEEDKFRLNIPIKSAPTSPISSPMLLSPQRMGMGDMFPPQYPVVQGFQAWSAPEMPTLDVSFGLPRYASSEKPAERIGYNAESSPLPSPSTRSPSQNFKSPSRPTSPLHTKASQETPVSVHPLPLPPRVTSPLQSGHNSQISSKQDFLPMSDQWQKGKLIGRGTFGSVYVATNRETGALCAMKEVEMLHDDPKSAECIKQLQQEINVLSKLKHPNIVQYYGSEIVDDKFYIYLEYVYPGSINKYVREHCGAITESVVRNFTRHILSGLSYLHSTKTIHRDIKGANLLVDAAGVVKLADFGMAKHLNGQTADLSLKGSPYWMAPELIQAVIQKDNSHDLAFAVDTWSLGCTIIEMLNGKPPWSEFEGAAAMFKVLRESPAIPESLSREGKDFLHCCFRRNPADRPSAVKLLEHPFLNSWHHLDAPPHAGRTPNPTKFMGRARSHKESLNPRSPGPNVGDRKQPPKSMGFAHYFSPMRLIRLHEMKLLC